MSLIDLHTHSNISYDATMSPADLVQYAWQKGIRTLALTDHNSCDGLKLAIAMGQKLGVEVITGIELNSAQSTHILGYGFDPNSAELKKYLTQLYLVYQEAAQVMLANLKKHYQIELSIEEVKATAGASKTLGRKMIRKCLIEKGYNSTHPVVEDIYSLESKISYQPKNLDPLLHIAVLKEVGALVVLAHPFMINTTHKTVLANLQILMNHGWPLEAALANPLLQKPDFASVKQKIIKFKKFGINGLEAYYPFHSQKETQFLLKLADELDLTVTGGSDFHGQFQVEIGIGFGNLRVPASVVENIKRRR